MKLCNIIIKHIYRFMINDAVILLCISEFHGIIHLTLDEPN